MKPSEIRTCYKLYAQGLISREKYNELIVPHGKVIPPVPQTVQLPFFDNAKSQKAKLLNLLQDGAKALHAYDYDIKEKWICWNFACKPDCKNSIEFAEKNGYDYAETATNLQGKNLMDFF